MNHRTPPRPPWEGIAGRCDICGSDIQKGRRLYCGLRCARIAMVLQSYGRVARRLLEEERGRECANCGVDKGPFDVDHIVPLWSLDEDEYRDIGFWLPVNLQLLCKPCHKSKTKQEAAQRAATKRQS